MLEIRSAQVEEAAKLSNFAARIFRETFEKYNTPENMAFYVSKSFGENKQCDEILDSNRRIVVVIEQIHSVNQSKSPRGPTHLQRLRIPSGRAFILCFHGTTPTVNAVLLAVEVALFRLRDMAAMFGRIQLFFIANMLIAGV